MFISLKKINKLFIVSFIVIFYVLIIPNTLMASEKNKNIITPSFTVNEIIYIQQLLKSVELRGDEVNNFLSVANIFASAANKINKDNNKPIKVDMPINIAQLFVTFMQRVRLNGAEAVQFKSIIDKVINAANNATPSK